MATSSSAVSTVTLQALAFALLAEVEQLQSEVVPKFNLHKAVQDYEAALIRCALARTNGRQRQAARLLDVKASTLNTKIRRYAIAKENDETSLDQITRPNTHLIDAGARSGAETQVAQYYGENSDWIHQR
jgi:DNA-binding protein Fis